MVRGQTGRRGWTQMLREPRGIRPKSEKNSFIRLIQKLVKLGIEACLVSMTQYKNEFTYASHCVSKNVTPRRMLKKYF